MKAIKRAIIAIALFIALTFGALAATGNTPLVGGIAGDVPIAHADCTNSFPPPSGVEWCGPTPPRE